MDFVRCWSEKTGIAAGRFRVTDEVDYFRIANQLDGIGQSRLGDSCNLDVQVRRIFECESMNPEGALCGLGADGGLGVNSV